MEARLTSPRVLSRRRRFPHSRQHRGAAAVELALVLPLFFVFIFGLIELSRIYWVQNSLKAACQDAARYGSVCGVTSDEVLEKVRQRLAGSVNPADVEILVKDASVYDTTGPYPHETVDGDEFADLPGFGPTNPLPDLDPGKMVLVRAQIAYEDFTLLPMGALARMLALSTGSCGSSGDTVFGGKTLKAYAFARHE